MKKIKIILLFILVCWNGKVFSQILKLDSILSQIERSNPMLKMYDEQVSAVNNYAQGSKSWMPPSVSSGPWQTPYKDFKGGMWMTTVQQMVPNPRKQNANLNFMQGMAPIEVQAKNVKKNELFSAAKLNYYEWVVLKKKYNELIKLDSLLTYILRLAESRYAYNKEKLSNIYKAQSDLFEVRNMETMILGEMLMRNVELNTLMNQDKSYQFDVDTTVDPHYYEEYKPDSSVISVSRSDIKQIGASINLVELEKKLEMSKRLPDFRLSASHMQSLGMMPSSFAAMGMITIPIAPWSAKEFKSNINALNNTSNALSFQKQALINETEGMITTLQIQIIYTKKLLTNYNDNIIPAYIRSYQASLLGYEQNTEDLFSVIDGLRMYRMARMNELEQLDVLLKLQVEYEKELEIR